MKFSESYSQCVDSVEEILQRMQLLSGCCEGMNDVGDMRIRGIC